MEPLEALRHFFGYTSFRPGQREIIDCLLKNEDVLAVMPTGGGKSICFQLPALLQPGVTLVISPLISLMKDQVTALIENGVPAAYLNASLSERQMRAVLHRAAKGAYKLIYVAPERLESPAFLEVVRALHVSMVCVDEAHCVSQWGHDFRPAYLKIAPFLSALESRPALCAFTATATERVRDDIAALLKLHSPHRFVTGFDRENLFFSVVHPADKLTALRKHLDAYQGLSGIVYCATRKTVDRLLQTLSAEGYSVAKYHAGMQPDERRVQQERFLHDEVRVMLATNAFGMGIDKPNVAFVIHYNLPGDIESYYQEAGRAGRDGSPADCILFFNAQDVRIQQYFLDHIDQNDALTERQRQRLRAQRQRRLDAMISYADATRCLRAQILRYFGEDAPERCGACAVCCGAVATTDVTRESQVALSCVARAMAKPDVIAAILRGERTAAVRTNGFDMLSTFGLLCAWSGADVDALLAFLMARGFLAADEDGCLHLRPAARDVLFGNLHLRQRTQRVPQSKVTSQVDVPDPVLLAGLQQLCDTIAKRSGVPSFAIFTTKTLRTLAAVRPQTAAALASIPGVSDAKLKKYGAVFLKEIRRHCAADAKK